MEFDKSTDTNARRLLLLEKEESEQDVQKTEVSKTPLKTSLPEEKPQQFESLDFSETVGKTDNQNESSFEQTEDEEQETKTDFSFRRKLITVVFSVTLLLLGGWLVGNVIAINNTAEEIAIEQSEYKINLAQYLSKISALEDPTKTPDEDETTLSPLENILPLLPIELSNPTEISPQSNWFDNICNWLSNLFRG